MKRKQTVKPGEMQHWQKLALASRVIANTGKDISAFQRRFLNQPKAVKREVAATVDRNIQAGRIRSAAAPVKAKSPKTGRRPTRVVTAATQSQPVQPRTRRVKISGEHLNKVNPFDGEGTAPNLPSPVEFAADNRKRELDRMQREYTARAGASA